MVVAWEFCPRPIIVCLSPPQYNANVRVVDHEGRNAYFYAQASGKTECADFLRANGCPEQGVPSLMSPAAYHQATAAVAATLPRRRRMGPNEIGLWAPRRHHDVQFKLSASRYLLLSVPIPAHDDHVAIRASERQAEAHLRSIPPSLHLFFLSLIFCKVLRTWRPTGASVFERVYALCLSVCAGLSSLACMHLKRTDLCIFINGRVVATCHHFAPLLTLAPPPGLRGHDMAFSHRFLSQPMLLGKARVSCHRCHWTLTMLLLSVYFPHPASFRTE